MLSCIIHKCIIHSRIKMSNVNYIERIEFLFDCCQIQSGGSFVQSVHSFKGYEVQD